MANYQHLNRLLLIVLIGLLFLSGCDAAPRAEGGPPSNALIVSWVYPTSLIGWAEESIADFNHQQIKTQDGRPIWVQGAATDAGQAVSAMLGGGELPALWTTAQPYWRDVLNQQVGSEVFLPNCPEIAQTPLVIGMWEPIARALGWPARTLGWLDIGSLAADPSAWAYYSGGEWGDTLRISHTHPGLSDSGVETLQALIYAAERGSDSITTANIENPVVRASVGAFEGAVAWFSTNTAQLRDRLVSRGIDYLSGGVLYESDVVMQGERDPLLVAIYPYEGTFVATFPSCVRASMDETTTGAVETFLAYLRDVPAQQRALAHGLRPVNQDVPVASPIDAAHGADPAQPTRIFAPPPADTVLAIQDLWQSQRQNVNMTLVLDVSGSMEGQKIEQVRLSANEFVQQMGDNDRLTVILFDDAPRILVPNTLIQGNRQRIINQINTITAGGGTSLYDSIVAAAEDLAKHRHEGEVNAMVVLSDGQDNVSRRFVSPNAAFSAIVLQSGASVHTIAYGADADRNVLRNIALATNGIAYEGDVATINDIYAEISAAFGGSAGIGR